MYGKKSQNLKRYTDILSYEQHKFGIRVSKPILYTLNMVSIPRILLVFIKEQ